MRSLNGRIFSCQRHKNPVKPFLNSLNKEHHLQTTWNHPFMASLLIYFITKLFFVDHSNIEGAREKGSKWKNVDIIEMELFIGCLLHTGALRLKLQLFLSDYCLVQAMVTLLCGQLFQWSDSGTFSTIWGSIIKVKTMSSTRCERDVFCPIPDLWDAFY